MCRQDSKLKSVPVREIGDVYYGFTSEVFRRRPDEELVKVPEWRCFSLQLIDRQTGGMGRTMDFLAPTDQEAVAWTIGLRTLCYQHGVWPPSKRLVTGDVLWKRAALRLDAAMWKQHRAQLAPPTPDGSPTLSMTRREIEQLSVAVGQLKLRRLYDALEAGLAAAEEERVRLGLGAEGEDPEVAAARRFRATARIAELRRREEQAAELAAA